MKPEDFLSKAAAAARAAGHVYPEYAACEAALESAWGTSALALEANNLFGQKQSHPPRGGSLTLPTREYLHGAWITVQAQWAVFTDWQDAFAHRMTLLRALENGYPHYRAALGAPSGDEFVAQVSKSWSTDPERAAKVLSMHRMHFAAPALAIV